jgi:hypothetical protein
MPMLIFGLFEQNLIHQKEDDTMEYIHPIEILSCKRLTTMMMDLGRYKKLVMDRVLW